MLLLLAHAAATCALAGLVWVVQLVVYPAFLTVGPTPVWAEHHAAHSRAISLVVLLPWSVQGLTCALLLVRRPAGVPLGLALLAGALGLATVVVTAAVSVPLHTRLGAGYDAEVAGRLLATNWLRVAAWTGSAALALWMTALATTHLGSRA
ncbi:MAG: hypothetical protein JWO60_930 [Frankiales bacterium]|nr:hypothetical protein [Frankiales bacterium]